MNKTDEWVLIGNIPVDSGQMMLVDPCYLDSWKGHRGNILTFDNIEQFGYDGACTATTKERASVFGNGMAAACSSGFGDGSYNVYVKYSDEGDWGTRVAEMKIVFIGEEEDDDY